MTEKQIRALQRIVDREASARQTNPQHPISGQHPSKDAFVVTDGTIFVKLTQPIQELPVGDTDDSLVPMLERELYWGMHLPCPKESIIFNTLTEPQKAKTNFMELAITDSTGISVSAKFNFQVLVDALEIVGETPQIRFGYGQLDPTTPTLLILNADLKMFGDPLVLVLPDPHT